MTHAPVPWRPPVVRVRARARADETSARALAERLDTACDDATDHAPEKVPGGADSRRGDGDRRSRPVVAARGATSRRARSAATLDPSPDPWTLLVDRDRRALVRPDGVRLEIDFGTGRTAARRHQRDLARQPLARALGVSRLRRRLGRAPAVVDATGGLGRDAWFAAALGCPVTLIERSPVVHALLESALARAANDPGTADVAARLTLLAGDAAAVLPGLEPARVEVVYVDPMYPPVRRRAAVAKGMQFLHALLGAPDEGDDARLLAAALDVAALQVTVKRPVGAPTLAGDAAFRGQRSRIESPGTRYDVYLTGGDERAR